MEKIAIITDSCADVPAAYANQYHIHIIPMIVSTHERSYKDGIDINAEDVYELQRHEMLKTASPQGDDVISMLEQLKNEGYTHAVILTIASALSGTSNQIRLFAQSVDDIIVSVFDSKSASIGNGAIVIETARLIAEGISYEELLQKIPQLIDHNYVYFSIDTLEYLEKGGRITKATAIVGTALKIKPILSFDKENGAIFVPAKVRGRKKVQSQLIRFLEKHIADHPHQIYNILIADGGDEESHRLLEDKIKTLFPEANEYINAKIGAALSAYLGKGLLGAGIQFIDEQKR
ncbi:DegV family protein [[Clostridium] spiroforme]|nr:DegV family protein [Thomasclavelia spiroformis]